MRAQDYQRDEELHDGTVFNARGLRDRKKNLQLPPHERFRPPPQHLSQFAGLRREALSFHSTVGDEARLAAKDRRGKARRQAAM